MNNKLLTLLFLLFFQNGFSQTKTAFLNAGTHAMKEGDYFTAGVFFGKALEFDEDDKDVIYKLAEACRLYNDYHHAAAWYERCLTLDKKNTRPLSVFYLAEMKKYLGDYIQAKKYFQNYYASHTSDSNFYSRKSHHEISACDTAIALAGDSLPVLISNAGKGINTVYSDFGAQQLGDSVLYFSSQRFTESTGKKKEKPLFLSKLLRTVSYEKGWKSPVPLDRLFNISGHLNCNSSISADHKLMAFSRCTPENISSCHAEIYFAKWDKGKWQNPTKAGNEINGKDWSSTQPAIATNAASGYVLYFSSDRPGGYGGKDLWRSFYAGGQFTVPENLGPVINTEGDEITPYFDNLNSILYFSSDWHAGLGGFDIFRSGYVGNAFMPPVNMGVPLNSSCNDLYYTVQVNNKEGWLTSNRSGSMYLYTQTCCYDIYKFSVTEPIPEKVDSVFIKDSLEVVVRQHRQSDSTMLTDLLPLKLYFDNDQPGRRSVDTVTKKSYEETYFEYLALKPEYLGAFRSESNKDSMQEAIDHFFTHTIEASYKNLERFAALLLQQLSAGRNIHITIQGCASPLAKDDYNNKLSKRRINSLVNYLKKYNNGELRPYLEKQKLILAEDPAGESLADKKVSDNFYDRKKSVYHPDACLERRIEIISVRYFELLNPHNAIEN